MVALGALGVVLHRKSLGWRLSFAYLLIVVVGIGRYSACFTVI